MQVYSLLLHCITGICHKLWRTPVIHGSEFSCRYRAFCYTVSLVHATNSGERVWGISQQESCVRFLLITLFSTLLKHRDTCFWYWSFFQWRLWFLSWRMFLSFWRPCEVLANYKLTIYLFIIWLGFGWDKGVHAGPLFTCIR